jgi:disulfide bond formation protein DsbB
LSRWQEYSRLEALLIRRPRRWFVHVLSLALLFAQLGMALHASSHLKADPHATPTQAQLCGQCASFSPVQNMVGNAPAILFVVHVSHDRAADCAAIASVPSAAFTAFRSRAPPSFV